MTTQYSALLGLALPVTGEDSGTWGDLVNDSITQLIEDSVAGYATADVTSGDWTLTTTGSGAANQARCAILIPTGTPGATRNITAPAKSKLYIVNNQSDSSVVIKASGSTGVTVLTNNTALVTWDGSDFVEIYPNDAVYAETAGSATTAVSATTATNLAGGNSGQIPYQTGAGATSYVTAGTSGQILTSNGTGAPTWSTPSGSVSLSGTNTWTGTQSFVGTSSAIAAKLSNTAELINVVSSAPTATTNFYVNSGAVQYYTSSAANNWTLNVAFSAGTALNAVMSNGDSITIAILTTQGASPYYSNALQVDGASVTVKWQGGTAPSVGNASGIDAYTFTIIKTASATYTVLGSQTQYK